MPHRLTLSYSLLQFLFLFQRKKSDDDQSAFFSLVFFTQTIKTVRRHSFQLQTFFLWIYKYYERSGVFGK